MGLFKKFVSQTKKPGGFLGGIMLNGMNSGHAQMADWGMAFLPEITPIMIADFGCGGGRNAGELLKRYSNAKVTAIDYSSLSVETARKYNREAIASGRCTVLQGDVSALMLPPGSYDLATAFETIYFWPGLEKCFREVARTLKAGGYFLICNESDGTDAAGIKYEKIIDGMKAHTVETIEAALKKAGFSEVQTQHHPSKPWITVLARK
jgi:ubiquinone/menaquinone biosynthesis C-methylase UbiE